MWPKIKKLLELGLELTFIIIINSFKLVVHTYSWLTSNFNEA